MAVRYTKSKSGYYKVRLSRSFPHEGFTYSPGHDAITVNETILKAMISADVVTSVAAG